ncbi:MAG: CGNR zinc finger domain-containing protein [Legionella sp.]|nr:CGNR zinc finger domain-containing protein [Legionella sp.]
MEKTLHDYFYINTGNEIKCYSGKDASFLIEAANFYIDKKKGKDIQHVIPELDAIVYECMEEFYKNGITDGLLNKLNDIIRDVKIQCLIENIENKLSAVHIAYIPKKTSSIIFGAYMFSHITSFSGLDGLNRCHNKDCLKFFLGRSNTKWCSNSCGSKFRVNKMRKNKKTSCAEIFL